MQDAADGRTDGRRDARVAGPGARAGAAGRRVKTQGLRVLARLQPEVGDAGVLAVALRRGGHDGGGRADSAREAMGSPKGGGEHQVGRVRSRVRVEVGVRVRHAFQLQLRL